MYKVGDFYQEHQSSLGLKLVTGKEGLKRRIQHADAQRPGLSLAGYMRGFASTKILIFGHQEMEFLQGLDEPLRLSRLQSVIGSSTPAVIIARGLRVSSEIVELCREKNIPLFRATESESELSRKVAIFLMEACSPHTTVHGALVEVFGIGMLIQGASSVGKSEAALGLVERGHRFISDDVVKIRKKEGAYLEGTGPEVTRHLMEIRGIGIINVAHLYGAVCVRPNKEIDLIVKLEVWDDAHFYDRLGFDETYTYLLGLSLPCHVLPVKPGRDVVLLLETIALNHRLKEMGYHSAKELHAKLSAVMSRTKKRVVK
jgi:HPr kinase/phosphorylase